MATPFNPLSVLFPASQGEESALGPDQLRSMRGGQLFKAGMSMLAQGRPVPQGTHPGFLAELGSSLGGAQEDWQKQLPGAAEHAAKFQQYSRMQQQQQALRDLAKKYGGQPMTPETEKQFVMEGIQAGLDPKDVMELGRGFHSLNTPPTTRRNEQTSWVEYDKDPKKLQLMTLDDKGNWTPALRPDGTPMLKNASSDAQTEIGERKTEDRRVQGYRDWDKVVADYTKVRGISDRLHAIALNPQGSPIDPTMILGSIAQLDVNKNAKAVGTMLAQLNRDKDAGIFKILTGGGEFHSGQDIEMRINRIIQQNGGVMPEGLKNDLVHLSDVMMGSYKDTHDRDRKFAVNRAVKNKWYDSAEDAAPYYQDAFEGYSIHGSPTAIEHQSGAKPEYVPDGKGGWVVKK